MDAVEFAKVGADLVDLGGRLNEKKAQRKVLDAEITELEELLKPLLAKHALMISELVGTPPAPPPLPPQLLVENGVHENAIPRSTGPLSSAELLKLKKKVIDYLNERGEGGVSAADVAEALHLDPLVVRQIMSEMMRAGRS